MWKERLVALGRTVFVPPRTRDERNIYFLYVEIIFVALLSAAGSFNSAYILRSGGSNALVGLLSSLPSLVAMFLFIPAASFLERRQRQFPWIVGSLFAARMGYAVIFLLPFFLRRFVPELTVAVLVLMTVPAVLFSTGWSPLMSDVIPMRSRATVLAWRSILSSMTIAPLIYLAGRWLDSVAFPLNYQLMYAVGFVAGAYSCYLVSRIEVPAKEAAPASARSKLNEPWFRSLWFTLRENPRFARIVVNTLVFDLGAWLVGPLYVIFFVRQLGATDGWLGLNGTLSHIGVIVGYWLWRRIIRHLGDARTLWVSLPLACIYPFMVALVPKLTFILFAGFLINVTSPGVGLSHGMMFLEMLPEGKKYSSTAIYSTVMNIGAFVGPLIGVAAADRIGIIPVLLIGGMLRVAGALLFYIFPIKELPAKRQAADAMPG